MPSELTAESKALALCVVAAIIIAFIPYYLQHDAYFLDDMQAQYMPTYLAIGRSLAAGHWPALTLQVVDGGALVSEFQYGLHNPVSLLTYLIINNVRDLHLAAYLLNSIYLPIVCCGAYVLCRNISISRPYAILVALTFSMNNFLFYWYQSSWFPGFIATGWSIWAMACLLRAGRSRAWWAGAAVSTYLTLTSGFLQADVVLAAFAASLALYRWNSQGLRPAIAVASTVAIGGIAALQSIVPLLATGRVAARTPGTFEEGLLKPNLYYLLDFSNPMQFGGWVGFGGYETVSAPIFLAGWYIAPLLPLLDWRKMGKNRLFGALILVLALLAAATQGPEQFNFMRFPFRFIPYAHLVLLLMFGLAATQAPLTLTRQRLTLVACIVLAQIIAGYQAAPGALDAEVVVAVLTAPFLVLAARDFAALPQRAATSLAAGALAVFVLTHGLFPHNRNVLDWDPPTVATKVVDLSQIPTGYTAVVEDFRYVPAPFRNIPPFGNMPLVVGQSAFFGYTPVGFAAASKPFCAELHGDICPDLAPRLLENSGFGRLTWADLFKIDRIVFARPRFFDRRFSPAAGWSCSPQGPGVTCLRQPPEPRLSGSLAYASPGLTAVSQPSSSAERETLSVGARTGRGDVLVFARLNWPGYRATWQGRSIPLETGRTGLVTVRLPEGSTRGGELVVSYAPPGQIPGLILFGIAVVLAGAGLLWGGAWTAKAVARPGHQANAQTA